MSQRRGDLLSNTGWLHRLGGTRCWCSWLTVQCSFHSSHPCLFLEPFLPRRQTLIRAHTLLRGSAVRRLFTSTCFLVQRIYWAAQDSSDYKGPVASIHLESFAEYAGKEATVRTRHGMMDWFTIGKGVRQGYILSPCLFNLPQSTSCEMLGWMKHKLESRLPGEKSIISDRQMTPHLWKKVKRK